MKIKSIKPSKIVLCCGKSGSCPIVDFEKLESHDQVVITDDYGGSVSIKSAEFIMLGEKIKELTE